MGRPKASDSKALKREREHHDRWASEIDVSAIDVRGCFEGSTSPENRFIIKNMGGLAGKRVLELGCGAGEASVYFAIKGAECIATDFSPGMVRTAIALAEEYGVSIEGRTMNAMELDFPDGSFDFVYAANLLHHVDPEATLREMHRVLRAGGKACFWDPLKHNPVINVYRRIASDVRSDDESPLDINILRQLRSLFSEVKYDAFWILTLWLFLRFYLIEHVDPNKERYWKKIMTEEERLRPSYLKLEGWDNMIKRWMPFLKRYAWNIAVVATR